MVCFFFMPGHLILSGDSELRMSVVNNPARHTSYCHVCDVVRQSHKKASETSVTRRDPRKGDCLAEKRKVDARRRGETGMFAPEEPQTMEPPRKRGGRLSDSHFSWPSGS